jgi:hypothetical protein
MNINHSQFDITLALRQNSFLIATTQNQELDIRATELSADTLVSVLSRLPHLKWFDGSWLENFTDQVLEAWMETGTFKSVQHLSLDTCDSLTDSSLSEMITRHGHQLQSLNLGYFFGWILGDSLNKFDYVSSVKIRGHYRLLEYFWINSIMKLPNIKYIVLIV